jgi:hypothetical protein
MGPMRYDSIVFIGEWRDKGRLPPMLVEECVIRGNKECFRSIWASERKGSDRKVGVVLGENSGSGDDMGD